MGLNKRDLGIIKDIQRFRVMDRNSISDLYFSAHKRPHNSANSVLKRLVSDGHIRRSDAFGTPYLYLSAESGIKANSAKIPHFLGILKAYKEVRSFENPKLFTVEPKYSKGLAEPDAFMIFRGTPFFLECQRSVYSQKQIDNKFERYQELFDSGILHNEIWQPKGEKIVPHIIVLSENRWSVDSDYPFKILQAQSFKQFMQTFDSKPKVQDSEQIPKQQPKQRRPTAISPSMPPKLSTNNSGKITLNF